MTNATNSTFELPDLSALEPYVGSEIVEILNSGDPLINSAVVLIVSWVLAFLSVKIIKLLIANIASRTKTTADDEILEAMEKPLFRLFILGGLYLSIYLLGLNPFIEIILRIIVSAAYLTITFFVLRVLDIIVKDVLEKLARRTSNSMDDEIIPIFHKAAKAIVWIFTVILILGVWGVDIAPFLAGLGIAGLAISFALKETLSNVISGVSLIMDKTFKVGDKVKLDSGELGVIHEITLRSTRIRTYDNEIIIIPNSNMASAKIKNYTQPTLDVRVTVPFTVAYGTDPDKVRKTILALLKKEKGILKEPSPSVVFSEMGDFALHFQAYFWVETYAEAYSKKIEMIDKIYKELNKKNIEIPFPTQTIYLRK